MQGISVKGSQETRLLQLYWELREAIFNLGVSRPDFEFGELFSQIGSILREMQTPAMIIRYERLYDLRTDLIRMGVMAKNWIDFGRVIGCLDSMSSIVEELLKPNFPVMKIEKETSQQLMELYSEIQVEINRAYAGT